MEEDEQEEEAAQMEDEQEEDAPSISEKLFLFPMFGPCFGFGMRYNNFV